MSAKTQNLGGEQRTAKNALLDSVDSGFFLESSSSKKLSESGQKYTKSTESSQLETRAGFVATLGRPNAGKSTLLNALVGEELALVSHKANATRKQLQLIVPHPAKNAQIIFIDTPGLHHQEKLLNQYMLSQALRAIGDCDLALYLAPANDSPSHYEEFLRLNERKKPHILILSKIDELGHDELLGAMARYAPYEGEFLALFPLSTKRGFMREKLLDLIASHLPSSPFFYDNELLTPSLTKEIYKEQIRQALFENLSDELPYEADVIVNRFEELAHIDKIYAKIIVEKPSQKGVCIGKDGQSIKRIGKCARQKIEALSQKKLFLHLDVEVVHGWSKQKDALKKVGYSFE